MVNTHTVHPKMNQIFSFRGCEYLLVLVDCTTTNNMVQWCVHTIGMNPDNVFNFFKSSIPDIILCTHEYIQEVYSRVQKLYDSIKYKIIRIM